MKKVIIIMTVIIIVFASWYGFEHRSTSKYVTIESFEKTDKNYILHFKEIQGRYLLPLSPRVDMSKKYEESLKGKREITYQRAYFSSDFIITFIQ